MNVHDLKTDSEAFWNTVQGNKRFEIRFNDRDFAIEDILILRETKHTGSKMKAHPNDFPLVYTKSFAVVMVTNIMRGPVYGLAPGWCIMSVSFKSSEIVTVPDDRVVPQ